MIIRHPEDYFIYYGIMTGASVAVILWNFIVLFREHPLTLKGINLTKHIKYTWITYLISLAYGITLYLDNVLLGLLSTAYAVGVYAFAMKIIKSTSLLLTDSLIVVFPRVVRFLKDNNRQELQNTMLKTVQMIISLAIPLVAGTFLLSEEIVLAVLGQAFKESATDLRLLSVFPLLKAYNVFLSKQVLIPFDKEKWVLGSLSFGSLIVIILIVILVPFYADKGVCIAMITGEFFSMAINLYFVKRADAELILFDWRSFWQSCLTASVFIPIIYYISSFLSGHWIVLFCSIGCCFAAYFFIQLLVFKNGFILNVKDTLLRIINKKWNNVF